MCIFREFYDSFESFRAHPPHSRSMLAFCKFFNETLFEDQMQKYRTDFDFPTKYFTISLQNQIVFINITQRKVWEKI